MRPLSRYDSIYICTKEIIQTKSICTLNQQKPTHTQNNIKKKLSFFSFSFLLNHSRLVTLSSGIGHHFKETADTHIKASLAALDTETLLTLTRLLVLGLGHGGLAHTVGVVHTVEVTQRPVQVKRAGDRHGAAGLDAGPRDPVLGVARNLELGVLVLLVLLVAAAAFTVAEVAKQAGLAGRRAAVELAQTVGHVEGRADGGRAASGVARAILEQLDNGAVAVVVAAAAAVVADCHH